MISDRELVARITAVDDQDALRLLVERHQGAVRGFLRRLLAGDEGTADDLAQETFILAYRKLHTLKSGGSLVSWLHSIAYRQFLQHGRKHARQTVMAEPPERGHDPRGAVEAEVTIPRLMALLSEEQRACMTLAYAAGMSHPEISGVTGFPLGTVKSHIDRGKRKLQEWLKEYDHSIPGKPGHDGKRRPNRA